MKRHFLFHINHAIKFLPSCRPKQITFTFLLKYLSFVGNTSSLQGKEVKGNEDKDKARRGGERRKGAAECVKALGLLLEDPDVT